MRRWRLGFLLVSLAALALAGCSRDSGTTKGDASSTPAGPAAAAPPASVGQRYSANAVWTQLSGANPPADLIARLQRCRPTAKDCVEGVMRDAGASAAAIAFFDETGWFLTDFREMGLLDLGRVLLPWRANANVQYYVMNGQPALVSPEEQGAKLSISDDAHFGALTAAVAAAGIGPVPVALAIFPADDVYESTAPLSGGGTRFVFQYNVVNVCHACGTGYLERVGLDFDKGGQFAALTLLGLCRSSTATLDLAGVPACPPASP